MITLTQLLSATIIVPTLLGTVMVNRLPAYGKIIVVFFYLNLLSEIISIALAKAYGNNMIVFYFFASLVAITIGVLYSKVLKSEAWVPFLIVPVTSVVEWFTYGGTQFNSYSFTLLNLLMIGITLVTFYKLINGRIDSSIFVFNGILLFSAFSSTIFFFTARYLQSNDLNLMMRLFDIHSWINSITNLAFAISLWTLSKSFSSAQ
jgi:hypothetical protein